MKAVVVGALAGAGLMLVCLSGDPTGALANSPQGRQTAAEHTPELVTLTTTLGDAQQQLTLIDTRQRVLAVYHIDAAGEVALRCVRNFHWDLQMNEFNGVSPLPGEIRSLIEQR